MINSEPKPQFCPRCPSGSQEAPIRNIYPDFAGRKEIRLLKVKCLNSSCPFEGNLNEYITNHEDICPHAKVSCTACGRQMKRVELQNHCLRDCTERTITCRWCNAEFVHKTMKQHNSVCPKLEILCEICKKSKLPREEMKLHQDPENGDCPRRKRCCKFRMVGCEFTAPPEQMPGHLKNNLQEHLNLMMGDYILVKKQLAAVQEKLKDYQSIDMTDRGKHKSVHLDSDEMVRKVVKEMKGKENGGAKNGTRRGTEVGSSKAITELKTMMRNNSSQKIKSLQLNHGVLVKKNEVFHDVIDVLNTEMEKTGRKVVEILHEVEQLKTSTQETEKHLKSVEQIESLENTAYGGVLLWKITNFSQKRRDAIRGKQTSLYSPHFFTSRYGCRVCCRIYLNGEGIGKNTYFSATLLLHSYDSSQPFPRRVRFVLYNRDHVRDFVGGYTPDRCFACETSPSGSNFLIVSPGSPSLLPLGHLKDFVDLDDVLTMEVHVSC